MHTKTISAALLALCCAGAAMAAEPIAMVGHLARITSTTPQVVEAEMLEEGMRGCTAVGMHSMDEDQRNVMQFDLIACNGKPTINISGRGMSAQDGKPGLPAPLAVGAPLVIQVPAFTKL